MRNGNGTCLDRKYKQTFPEPLCLSLKKTNKNFTFCTKLSKTPSFYR